MLQQPTATATATTAAAAGATVASGSNGQRRRVAATDSGNNSNNNNTNKLRSQSMHSNEEPPMSVIVDSGKSAQQQQQQQKLRRSNSSSQQQRQRKTSSCSANVSAKATPTSTRRAQRQHSNASDAAKQQQQQQQQQSRRYQQTQSQTRSKERQAPQDSQQLPRRRAARRRHGGHAASGSSSDSSCNGSCSSDDEDDDDDGDSTHSSSGSSSSGTSSSSSSGEPNLPYPGFPEISMKALTQYTRPRNWCLMLITNPWFERISILVILLNCITLGMYQPCVDDTCLKPRCRILQIFDDIIFAFFALEMTIKMVAMGMCGKNTYLADSWNRLDFFIVLAGLLEYVMHVENLNLTAIRTIRVLRPLRAINRIPSMRILVMLLLDTLPMLGNVLLLCFFVFFIFGIIGVQLWEGILRQRCTLDRPDGMIYPITLSQYYEFSKDQDYICSTPEDSGMHLCGNFPPYRIGSLVCSEQAKLLDLNEPTNTSCVNWNQYYTTCKQSGENPFQGTISFDNIGMAWVAIFLVISLEGWTDIMYYVQDAHSFWDWIYFVLLIVHQLQLQLQHSPIVGMGVAAAVSGQLLSSSDNTEQSAIGECSNGIPRRTSSFKKPAALHNHSMQLKPPEGAAGEQKTILLKLPQQVIDSEQLIVNLPQTIGSIANPYADCSELGIHDAMTCQELLAFSVAFSAALPTGQSTLESFYTSLARCDPHTMEALKAQHKRAPTAATAAAVGAAADVVAVEAAAPAKNLELTAVSAAVPMPTPTATPSHRRKHQHQHHNNNNNTKHNHHSGGQSSRSAQRQQAARQFVPTGNYMEDYACCYDLYQNALSPLDERRHQRPRGPALRCLIAVYRCIMRVCSWIRRYIKRLVEHKYFQQGILLAILINTLSMGIEYHDQPEELTAIVETSNIVFSGIFAVEMLLKVVAEGPFRYIANGFNVFDGIIVILSAIEICQQFLGNGTGGGGSGLSVLRTFRLLRILKLVRFMPNLRRQLFVMLRTMDNVAVFFSLLVLFIFIFSILGMYLFGGKFCKFLDESGLERECTCPEIISRHPQCECDRKHFNNILWATVTVFQRNERREREQRELVKKLREETLAENYSDGMYDESRSEADSSTTNDSYYEVRNRWRSAEDVRKLQDSAELIIEAKSNMHRQRLLQPMQDYQINELPQQQAGSSGGASSNDKEASGKLLSHDDQAKPRGGLKKTYSIKDRRSDAPRLSKMRLVRDPPMITTTAATPQDSPSTTLEPGMSFRQWGDTLEPPSSPSPSLLKPPNIFSGGQRVLDEGIPSIDLIPPSPVLAHKPLNILNASQLQGHTPSHSLSAGSAGSSSSGIIVGDVAGGSSSLSSVIIDDISKNSGTAAAATPTPIYVPTMLQPPADLNLSELSLAGGASTSGSSSSERLTPLTPTTIATSPPPLTNASGFKQRFRRSSSKKRTRAQQHEQEELNNGKDTNRLSPQNSIRRLSNTLSIGSVGGVGGGVGSRRASACIFNSQVYQNLNQAPKLKAGAGQRRMSSIELAFSKTSHLNLHNLEANRKSLSYTNSKIDLDKWQKGSEPDMLQQFRQICTWFVNQKWFDNVVLLFIALNCITLAMERPNIPPSSTERLFLSTANYVFTVVFTVEMFIKVFRLLRSLRPLRVINRAPGLKLVVQTLLSSLRPIGNIVLICCTFFIIFGILGVQLFKGTFFYCEGEHIKNVRNRRECESIPGNVWTNRKYNFDDLGKALMSLFVLSSRDGWVNIMYTGLDAVGVDQQPIVNYNEWRLLYFIAFILLVGFFVLNMFVGVVVENFHRCREEQEKEEKIRRAAKRALQMEKKRRRMHEPPYYTNYSPTRMFVHNVVTSKYFDLAIAAVIGLNVVTMAMEYYKMPNPLKYALKIFNYFFTAVFILEANMKLVALGWHLYLKDRWNQLDVGIVLLSIVGIVLEELETNIIPINPTIIRVMRVLRIARVLKLLKMAKGIRALLDTVMQALPQVGNLGLLFFLLFFIFAALGVELFGRLECSDEIPCQGLGEHAHFANFGMAFLTLFRVATGDNWNGIMKDTLRDNCDDAADCVRNCCVSSIIAPIFFVIFVLMAQFVLVNVVVAVLMKHLEESHKQMEDELDMEQQQQHQGIQGLNLAELGTVNAAAALQRRTRRASAAGSGFRRRGILAKERSLDEQAIRRRNLETKRTSCDSLALDYRRGTIFESMESDAPSSNSYDLDVRSIRSAELPPTAPPLAVVSALVTPTPSTVSSVSAPPPTRRPFGWSQSVDQGCMRSSLLLSVPRSMPPRSRSGSTKQLFKQQALDEDADMDESSLLLPSVSSAAATPPLPPPAAAAAAVVPTDGPASIVAKSDSADILRIISERRRMDQRDQCGNEDSDYNELLLVKSPQSSTE
ncbi:Ca-alpha1T [Drosophila busckii]|uniref:Ca-alpha1T n=1 Tax=Drosophila busckii TaxID=30019 RepID=A0A0M4ERJ3_DROBS|nr:Ca-alpha1T [Drosophila busckii]